MLCEICGKNEADVHIKAIGEDGEGQDKHICHDCMMRKKNEIMGTLGIATAIQSMLRIMGSDKGEKSNAEHRFEATCESCGLTFGEFEKSGLLGCPECYGAFRERIEEMLIENNKSALYAGGGRDEGASQLARLRRELETAIAQENYEEAAVLRDKIRTLSGNR